MVCEEGEIETDAGKNRPLIILDLQSQLSSRVVAQGVIILRAISILDQVPNLLGKRYGLRTGIHHRTIQHQMSETVLPLVTCQFIILALSGQLALCASLQWTYGAFWSS